jgi:hypothetical protein
MTRGRVIYIVLFEIDQIGANQFGINSKQEAFAVPRIDTETRRPILTAAIDLRDATAAIDLRDATIMLARDLKCSFS